MINFCLTKEQIQKIAPEMKKLGGERLTNMTKEELSTFFSTHLGSGIGTQVADSFRYATLSHKETALKDWARKVLTIDEAKIINKQAKEIAEQEVYKGIDGEIIEKALGVEVTKEEVDKVNELYKKLKETRKIETDNISGFSDDYYKTLYEVDKYLDEIVGMSNFEQFTKIWSRGVKLFSIASPLFNIIANTTSGFTETFVRALSNRKIPSFVNKSSRNLVASYIKEAHKVYSLSGRDITRVLMLEDRGRQVLGEYFTQVSEPKNKLSFQGASYFIQKWIFKTSQGMPDIWFSAYAFADSVYIQASKVADSEGLSGDDHKRRTEEITKNVFNLKYIENEDNKDISLVAGIREIAVKYAKKSTGQDDRKIIDMLLSARKGIDEISGINLGTAVLDPFIKTPVNFKITALFEYSPVGFVNAFIDFGKVKKGTENNLLSEQEIKVKKQEIYDILARAGLGAIFMAILNYLLPDDDDYMNAYEIATKNEKVIGNYYNSIIVSGKAISTDILGFLQTSTTLLFSVRKSKGGEEASYLVDNIKAFFGSFPVIDTILGFTEQSKYRKDNNELLTGYASSAIGSVYSMFVPNILTQFNASYDGFERQKEYDSFMADVAPKLPIERYKLTKKQDIFGQEVEIPPVANVLFGARVKNVNSSEEMSKLKELANNVPVDALSIDTIAEVKALKRLYEKDEISKEEYNAIMFNARKRFGEDMFIRISSKEYENKIDFESKKAFLIENKKNAIKEAFKIDGVLSRVQNEIIKDTKK